MAKLRSNQFLLPSGALITELPILFQTDLVRAILADRKIQTRRLPKKLEDYCKKYDPVEFIRDEFREDHYAFFSISVDGVSQWENPNIKSPFGKPGDLLWVKENWVTDSYHGTRYQADFSDFFIQEKKGKGFFKPSIHLSKEKSRIWLMIEDIRVERLQDISEADAIAEGIEEISTKYGYDFDIYKDYMGFMPDGYRAPRYSFKSLIISIYGEKFWNANPYIWVIRYRVLSKTGRPSLQVIEQNYLETTSSTQGEAGRGRKEVLHD